MVERLIWFSHCLGQNSDSETFRDKSKYFHTKSTNKLFLLFDYSDKLWQAAPQLVFCSQWREGFVWLGAAILKTGPEQRKMAGTITALKFQKRNKDRANVYLDGEYAFGLDAIEAAQLRKGQILSDAEIGALKARDERNRIFNRAIHFLSYRPRSRAELQRFLRGKAIAEEVIADVVVRLEQARYLDDEAFARFWVENREQFRPRSQRALRYELRQKGVSDEVINRVLGGLDEQAAAWRAIEGRLDRWAKLPGDEFRQKVMGYLSRRGFDYSTISVALAKAYQILKMED